MAENPSMDQSHIYRKSSSALKHCIVGQELRKSLVESYSRDFVNDNNDIVDGCYNGRFPNSILNLKLKSSSSFNVVENENKNEGQNDKENEKLDLNSNKFLNEETIKNNKNIVKDKGLIFGDYIINNQAVNPTKNMKDRLQSTTNNTNIDTNSNVNNNRKEKKNNSVNMDPNVHVDVDDKNGNLNNSLGMSSNSIANDANTNNFVNKQILFNNSIYSNRHIMNDPSIQEALSPFFQPFGVDVTHLPMTNPPIFQTSSMMYDDPGRRRRISISNGQISQLGEDLETLDNLYDSQPPPMPHKYDMGHSHMQKMQQQQQQQQQQQVQPNIPVNMVLQNQYAQQYQDLINMRNATRDTTTTSTIDSNINDTNETTVSPLTKNDSNNIPHDSYIQKHINNKSNLNLAKDIIDEQDMINNTNNNTSTNNNNYTTFKDQQQQHMEGMPMKLSLSQHYQLQQQQLDQLALMNQQMVPMMNNEMQQSLSGQQMKVEKNLPQQNSRNPNINMQQESLVPGTQVWKRTRLLERNRIAASKCRQRKKVAQLQLQKDYDEVCKENKIIKKKLGYYEKLVSKFKKFSEAHLKNCGSNKESLKIIEEMLMIDSGIHEVDESGLVVKMEDK